MPSTIYRAGAGAFIAFAVGMQYWFMVRDDALGDVLASSVKFFSFFTILTNVLAAMALLAPVIAPSSALAKFLDQPRVRTAIAAYIIVVGVVYYLLLRDLSQREGWPLIFERLLHYVTPPLFVLDWVLFVPKRGLDWRIGLSALAFPLVYLVWTLLHGSVSGWYPYPFLDAGELGYARTAANSIGLMAIFIALVAALSAVGRWIGPDAEPSR